MNRLISLRRFAAVLCVTLLAVSSLAFLALPASAETHEIKMGGRKGLVFEPKKLTITAGDTLTFINKKMYPHNVIFEGHPELSQKKLMNKKKESFSVAISEPGEYSFYCTPHKSAGMKGTVIVE